MKTSDSTENAASRLRFLLLCQYAILFCITAWFWMRLLPCAGWRGTLFLGAQAVSYPLLYQVPSLLLLLPAFCRRERDWLFFASVAASSLYAAIIVLLLLLDSAILIRFGYHINGLVLNLLFTPGGFRAMGLDYTTILSGCIPILFVFAIFAVLAWTCLRHAWSGKTAGKFSGKVYIAALSCMVVAFFLSLVLHGLADFYYYEKILARTESYPLVIPLRMRSFLKRLGCKEPSREQTQAIAARNIEGRNLNYPLNPIRRAENWKRYNVIWLMGESLRADLLSKEIMPATWNFAQTGLRFQNHYSGGNGTRPAMFSIFYGLHGLNWETFLNHRRAPVFMEWMQQDNYQFLCQTSSDFTYPEFDKTIFSSLPSSVLLKRPERRVVDRDRNAVQDMIVFLEKRDSKRPFFLFSFFESTHAPYSFEADSVIRKDYPTHLNYALITAKDAPGLYNRCANAAHYIDLQLQKLYQYLAAHPDLLENTIVIFSGDHGEEFYEKGRLGHNSTFVEEQIRPAFFMRIPGVKPQVITAFTHHVDVVPTLAPYFGVENPSSDYCIGQNLLQDYKRTFFLACGWDEAYLMNGSYKYRLPIGKKGTYARKHLTHQDDSPCSEQEQDEFYLKHAAQLHGALEELNRFVRK